jgi:AmmeMemoRadiSam system protein B
MFYPGEKSRLEEQLSTFIRQVPNPRRVLAAISPHAGYMYSGGVAGAVFSEISVPEAVLILGPNHRGLGAPVALTSSGEWDMPLGSVPIDEKLAECIMKITTSVVKIEDDPHAHSMEHSIEVQVPFLQYVQPEVRIVPIGLSHLSLDACLEISQVLVQGIRDYGKEVLLVASTDMTHYESQKAAQEKDKLAMDRILERDPQGLYDTVAKYGITMCGVIPTTIVLEACNILGARKTDLIRYATSGDVTGDYAQVVGYAGFIVY